MEAGKVLDAYGHAPGNTCQQADGKQAFTQTTLKGTETWVRLPKDRWPKEWHGKYKDPVVRLNLALYGHPDSGGFWAQHCEKMLGEVGFQLVFPAAWPSVLFHPTLKLLLAVYVDDFKMSGPSDSMKKGWELISSKIVWTLLPLWVVTWVASTILSHHLSEEQVTPLHMSLTRLCLILPPNQPLH